MWSLLAATMTLLTACDGGGATDAHVTASGELRFSPTTVEIPAGGTVTWRNDGIRPHTITSISRERQPTGDFDSGELIGTGTFSHTFEEAGTYLYHCDFHGRAEMVGTVVVVAP